MKGHRLAILAGFVLAAAPAAVLAVLMYRGQTSIDVPTPGQEVPLSRLVYKGSAFQSTVTAVRFESKSEEGAEKVETEWSFLCSNTDGQLHKLEIYVRLLDESGKQLESGSARATLTPGAKDQVCKVKVRAKAEDWKATKSVKIVADWTS